MQLCPRFCPIYSFQGLQVTQGSFQIFDDGVQIRLRGIGLHKSKDFSQMAIQGRQDECMQKSKPTKPVEPFFQNKATLARAVSNIAAMKTKK